MKKFSFPLAQALEWRRTRVRVEEAKLEKLYVELTALAAQAEQLREEQTRAEQVLLTAAAVTGAELATLDTFRRSVRVACARFQAESAVCEKQIASQMGEVLRTRRDVRLLEQLHQRKLAEWRTELGRETDREAEELHLAKFTARRPRHSGP
jgi:flagellar biosynthesis chaperone FliJ